MLLSPAIDLDQRRQRQRRALQQQGLDAAVLVAELDLQVVHLLAMAHEAEVPGLDHAGVDRADADLMHLLPAHHEERVARPCAAGVRPRSAPA
jgi:hypothetical protein